MLPEFKKRIDTLRDILVGAVPSPAGQIEQITYALIYKFMNDIDDRAASLPGGKRSYFTGEYEKYSWHELMTPTLGAHDRLTLYREALGSLAKNPGLPTLFQEIYQNAYLTFNDPRVLTLFLKEIDNFKHSNSDDIGDAYEYLLQITGAQGDVGQFRTPRHIIKFIVEAVNPTKSDSVLDPAVGTAGFLIAAYNHVKHHHDGVDEISGLPSESEDRLTSDELDKLHRNYHGFDIDPTMVRTAKVNMYLHGFKTPDIKNHDSLSSEDYWNERYDVILANPPFMSPKGGIKPHDKFGIVANRAEVLFVDYIASHLKPTGRAGIIVPEGIIFQSGKAYKELRKNLVDNYLYAVVSLPSGVFNPYAGVKTSILLLDRELAKQRDEILFVKIENDGYSLGAQRRETIGSQFPEALNIINRFRAGEEVQIGIAHTVLREKITNDNDFNLVGDRYKSVKRSENQAWPMVKLGDIIQLNFGERITKRTRQGAKFPVYGGGGESFRTDEFNRSDEYVIARFAMSEKCVRYVIGKFWMMDSGGTLSVKPEYVNKVEKDYVGRILLNRQKDVYACARGGAQKNLKNEHFYEIEIPLPPIEIQREITAELNGYQKIIDAAQTIIKTYKPVMRINPVWKEVKIGDVSNLMTGGTPSRSILEYWDGGTIPWLVSGDIHKGVIDSCEGRITELALENSNARVLPKDSVMIALNGQGKTRATVALLDAEGFTCNQSLVAITPRVDELRADFLYYQMKGIYSDIRAINGENERGGLNMQLIKNIKIRIAPLDEQRRIVIQLQIEQELVDANKKLIELYTQKIKTRLAEVWGE